MPTPKILVLPGSTRTGSHNARLAALAGVVVGEAATPRPKVRPRFATPFDR